MAESIDVELHDLANRPGNLAEVRRDVREHTIDALIQAVAGAPAATIRETLGTVLAESLAAEDATIQPLEIAQLEQRLRDLDR